MNSLQTCLVIFISIHILLALSSFLLSSQWLPQQPSTKLRLARLLFASCIISPILVSFIKPNDISFYGNFVSIESFDENFKSQVVTDKQSLTSSAPVLSKTDFEIPDLSSYLLIFLFVGILYQGLKLLKDLRKLKSILNSAFIFRTNKKITIKVTDRCLIPFATRTLNKAYIILPVSLLNSSTNMKMAIAHEGQHHRQGDCLWAYCIESIRLIFWGNPAVARWQNFLNELQELSCDETLVGHQRISAHDYGTCLFKVAQTASTYSKANHREFACAVGMTWESPKNKKSFITRRICMLSQYQVHASRKSFSQIAFITFAVLAPLCSAYAAKGALSNPTLKRSDKLTFDPRIQSIAETEIAEAVKRYRARSGAVVVADSQTGQIVAFAESGDVQGNNSWHSRLVPVASIIKPFVAAAAIEAGVASESQVYNCRSPYDVSGTKFMNYDPNVRDATMTEAIAKSINVCMIKVAQDLGSVKFRKALADFGFDVESQWRNDRSDALQLANAALGLSVPTTMETVAKAIGILANKGHIPTDSGSVVSESSIEAVTRMLVEAVENGTGKRAAIPNVRVAGKTGTISDSQSSIALFAGYTPDASRLATFVLIENGHPANNQEATGGTLAAPVFHKVTSKVLSE